MKLEGGISDAVAGFSYVDMVNTVIVSTYSTKQTSYEILENYNTMAGIVKEFSMNIKRCSWVSHNILCQFSNKNYQCFYISRIGLFIL